VKSTDVIVPVDSTHEMHKGMVRTLELLKIDEKEIGPIYFVLEGCARFESDAELQDHHQYFYEEHTCPTNFIHGVVGIFHDGDRDPHGVFDHVKSVWMTERYLEMKANGQENEYLFEVFPQLKGESA